MIGHCTKTSIKLNKHCHISIHLHVHDLLPLYFVWLLQLLLSHFISHDMNKYIIAIPLDKAI